MLALLLEQIITDNADILESRSWNEGAKIYTTRNAIETFDLNLKNIIVLRCP